MDAGRLEARDISVSFSGLSVLRSVHLALPTGEVHGLIGPNGAGKSTLLNVLNGFLGPSAGEVCIDDRIVTGASVTTMARRGVARTFQAARVFPRLTVLENVWTAAAATGLRRGAALVRARELLAEFQLSDLSEAPAGSVSYGIERRVALARALAAKPRFLLLDEPAAGLDEAETGELAEEILRLKADRGLGVLVVEHDVELVMGVCDVVHVLAEGVVIASGAPTDVRSDPAVLRAYLGTEPPS